VIYAALLLGCALLLTAALFGAGPLEERLAALTAGTARMAFPLFWLAFTASAWQTLVGSGFTRWLVRRRRHIGLSFAVVHFLHLGALVALHAERGEVPGPVTLAGGGTAYAPPELNGVDHVPLPVTNLLLLTCG